MLLQAARGSQPERVVVYVEARGCSRERPRAGERGWRSRGVVCTRTQAQMYEVRGTRYEDEVCTVCTMWCVVVRASAPESVG